MRHLVSPRRPYRVMGELYLPRRDERGEINVAALLLQSSLPRARAGEITRMQLTFPFLPPGSNTLWICGASSLSNGIPCFISYPNHVLMKTWEEEVKLWQANPPRGIQFGVTGRSLRERVEKAL